MAAALWTHGGPTEVKEAHAKQAKKQRTAHRPDAGGVNTIAAQARTERAPTAYNIVPAHVSTSFVCGDVVCVSASGVHLVLCAISRLSTHVPNN